MKKHTPFLALGLLMLGTTYIIHEEGVEVGRWEENDGKQGQEIVDNDKPKPPPSKLKLDSYSAEGGYTAAFRQTSENPLAYWTISGRVVDWLNLHGVPGVIINFGGAEETSVKSDSEGFFSVKVPALEKASYGFSCKTPPEYYPECTLFKKTPLSQLSYQVRLERMQGVQFGLADDFYLNGNNYEIQFGVKRKTLTSQEANDIKKNSRVPFPSTR